MKIILTFKQKLRYYSVVGFILLTPILLLSSVILNYFEINKVSRDPKELINLSLFFVTIAFLFYLFRNRKLKFNEFNIATTTEEFKKAIELTSKQQEWKIEKQTINYLRAFRGPDYLGSEMITIHRKENQILINCIPDPNKTGASVSFGLISSHIDTFTRNLRITKQNSLENEMTIPIAEEKENKWTLLDYLLRIFGYSFCLLFVFISIFLLIPEGNYFMGILIGSIGVTVLVFDLKKILKKTAKR